MEKILEAFVRTGGLTGLMMAALLFIVWRMIIWMMAWVREREKAHDDERIKWLCAFEKGNELQAKTLDGINDHDKRADERGRYVREEHKQMIETLARINGYKKDA